MRQLRVRDQHQHLSIGQRSEGYLGLVVERGHHDNQGIAALPVAATHLRDVRPLGPGGTERLAALFLDLVAEGRVCAKAVEIKNRIAHRREIGLLGDNAQAGRMLIKASCNRERSSTAFMFRIDVCPA